MTGTTAPVTAPAVKPVADYGLLADCSSSALVDRAGSIDWLCVARFDSAAIFARVLDPGAGHWSIRPAGAFTSERRYLPGTLVVETTFATDSGRVRLLDAMAFAEGQRRHDLGLGAPPLAIRARVPLDVFNDVIQPFPAFSEVFLHALASKRLAAV